MQAVAIEGEPQVGPSSEPDWYYVIVLAGQSNAMAYGEGSAAGFIRCSGSAH
ncbi:phage protein YjhS encoded within prophage CP-933O [Escherichia coli]|uniref:Phage protein YjhS encoded within prophage CP-933O n=1 Tax=Escherichia coli TaxID=562 RepID=A0A376UDL9_ECOLX|nr:phage protein YjhS encoded within prophage CP-933O [Escherichia coli]